MSATVSLMCKCGDPWSVHASSGETSAQRPCWGLKGQSTPYDWHLCGCPGFRPVLLLAQTAEGTPSNSWFPLSLLDSAQKGAPEEQGSRGE